MSSLFCLCTLVFPEIGLVGGDPFSHKCPLSTWGGERGSNRHHRRPRRAPLAAAKGTPVGREGHPWRPAVIPRTRRPRGGRDSECRRGPRPAAMRWQAAVAARSRIASAASRRGGAGGGGRAGGVRGVGGGSGKPRRCRALRRRLPPPPRVVAAAASAQGGGGGKGRRRCGGRRPRLPRCRRGGEGGRAEGVRCFGGGGGKPRRRKATATRRRRWSWRSRRCARLGGVAASPAPRRPRVAGGRQRRQGAAPLRLPQISRPKATGTPRGAAPRQPTGAANWRRRLGDGASARPAAVGRRRGDGGGG